MHLTLQQASFNSNINAVCSVVITCYDSFSAPVI